MIEAQNLRKVYGSRIAVKDVSFKVPEGKTFVLLGISGSGKTTTLKMINRLIPLSGGEVWINGKNISDLDDTTLRRNIGYVIQNIGLFPHLNISENISIVPELLNWEPGKIRDRVTFLLDLLNLNDIDPSGYPDQLSGGQQQRVGIARALAADPEIVLMDEPFGALDPITRGQIRAEFRKLEEIIHKTVVMVTHDVLEAWEVGDIICLMDEGKVVQVGSPYELTWEPEAGFIKDFLKPYKLQLEMLTLKWSDIKPFVNTAVSAEDDESYDSLMKKYDHDHEMILLLQEAFLKYKKSRA